MVEGLRRRKQREESLGANLRRLKFRKATESRTTTWREANAGVWFEESWERKAVEAGVQRRRIPTWLIACFLGECLDVMSVVLAPSMDQDQTPV